MSPAARLPRHASPSTVLSTVLLSAIFAFVVTAVSVPGDVLGASVTKSALCTTNLRTSPSASAPSKVTIPAGTRVAVVVAVTGGAWHASCAGKWLTGTAWYRITAVNAKSVSSLYGVTYLYAASGLFKLAPFVRYVACTVNLRTGHSKYRPIRTTLRLDAKVVVATTVTGTAWRSTCTGKAVTGSSWYRISAINGKTVRSLYGVSYLYAVSGLFKTAPTTTASAPTPPSRVFYMSPSGSDTADGSIGSPLRTFRGLIGARSLQPGDTIFVRGGTYYSPSGAGETWAPSVSGTAAAPITIKAYPGETPVFDGQGAVPQAFVLVGVRYLTFEGLTFTRYRPVGNGVLIVSGADHLTFRNIRATANTGTNPDTDQFFYIRAGSSDIFLDTVSVTGTTAAAVLMGNMTSPAVSNVTVQNSHLYGNGRGIIDGNNTVNSHITGNVIENNTMAQVHFHSNGVGWGSAGAVMTGNTLRGSVGLWVESLSYSPIVETNDCVDSPKPFVTGWPLSSGSVYTLAQWQATGRGTGDTVGLCP